MSHPKAGLRPSPEQLIDAAALERQYYSSIPDPGEPGQRVAFGTSGHRGTPGNATFTEAHILAITQAICDYRKANGIAGPLFLGKDTHAVSTAAERTALEVLAANGLEVYFQAGGGATPTPVISRAILVHNRTGQGAGDGIVISPSHNPPADGGFKYNPPHGGPAGSSETAWIEKRANELLAAGNRDVRRAEPAKSANIRGHDFVVPYVKDLAAAIDFEVIRGARLRLGADPLGGASLNYWKPIAETYGLDIDLVNPVLDPAFSFMTCDHDGQIRMDCSSPWAMAGLVKLKDQYNVAFGNDPDADRHGIVTPAAGLMNPNHYLAVAIDYLLGNRPQWRSTSAVGKTLVSSSMIDRVVARHHRTLAEVPVGFKWFAGGLHDGSFCFGGEESAGASFLERGGAAWTTDKDGILLNLLAAEITARTGKDPGALYGGLTSEFGSPVYTRIDTAATPELKKRLSQLGPEDVTARELAGEPIVARLTRAPFNDAAIGGLKVVTANGWFAARPSGTENIYKIYAESFRGAAHLDSIVEQARGIVSAAVAN